MILNWPVAKSTNDQTADQSCHGTLHLHIQNVSPIQPRIITDTVRCTPSTKSRTQLNKLCLSFLRTPICENWMRNRSCWVMTGYRKPEQTTCETSNSLVNMCHPKILPEKRFFLAYPSTYPFSNLVASACSTFLVSFKMFCSMSQQRKTQRTINFCHAM